MFSQTFYKGNSAPQLFLVAGPNGAGKSTFVKDLFPILFKDIPVINPDVIASELTARYKSSGEINLLAARKAIYTTEKYISNKKDFGKETTLSGNNPLRLMQKAKAEGYYITLVYIGIRNPEYAVERVEERTKLGGHAIPKADIYRRYKRSLNNLSTAIQLADLTFIFDNSSFRPQFIAFVDHDSDVRLLIGRTPEWLDKIDIFKNVKNFENI